MAMPGFLRLAETGALAAKVERARGSLESCGLCPRTCGVDRIAGSTGYCAAGPRPRVYRHMAHSGEEPPISGANGSGVIFFSHCTMSCAYCQNYRMSQERIGFERSVEDLAGMMSSLARAGCHNLNLVSATQYLPAILEALLLAARAGVSLPVVWNTSGYEGELGLEILDGVIDVYLADARYASADAAARYSDAPDYVEVNRAALREMKRQVGPLETDDRGLARRGLIVRHLVLPGGVAGTEDVLAFVASELGPGVALSLMAQYYPTYRARDFAEIARRITPDEWAEAVRALEATGIGSGWVQEYLDEVPEIAGTEVGPDREDPDCGRSEERRAAAPSWSAGPREGPRNP
jgi:putative pyruvate formate lyase activating enzyme